MNAIGCIPSLGVATAVVEAGDGSSSAKKREVTFKVKTPTIVHL